jgi:hypothetical protein
MMPAMAAGVTDKSMDDLCEEVDTAAPKTGTARPLQKEGDRLTLACNSRWNFDPFWGTNTERYLA